MKKSQLYRYIAAAIVFFVLAGTAVAAKIATPGTSSATKRSTRKVRESARTQRKISRLRHTRRVRYARRSRRHRYYERFTANSFSENDQTAGDIVAGEDPVVRQAAIDALGNMNGTVVAIDPTSGRILAMVNQRLALSEGATPCSTIKLAVGLAALSEGIVTRNTPVRVGRRAYMTLTEALAKSNNTYFEALGRSLGFERIHRYATQFGLGELAGYNIEGEHLGIYPDEELDAKLGGVGRMCSFGDSISMTPLQLGAMVAAMANGGTLYYLQHPTTPEQVLDYQPKVKRTLEIAKYLPEMSDGMAAAVQYGTARPLRVNFSEEQILGKTGTCSNSGTRYGWFASYANTNYGRIVTVVFLEGGRPTYGPKAAEIAGRMYRGLYDHSFFAAKTPVEKDGTAASVGVSQ
ncbi:MAG TPA: penicillin-binding transpeptidase domain-containing protein [Terriglobales bacterium]|jgi:penicillin-binding protein 2|nr:penicillin-binding transpeptidase domain-containing protein [Terriglobales bacterium]